MLAVLHRKCTEEEVFTALEMVNAGPMWKGVIQVLAANVGDAGMAPVCRSGLLRILRRPVPHQDKTLAEIDRALFSSDASRDVDLEIAVALVDALPRTAQVSRFRGLLQWMPSATRREPRRTLPLMEKIAARLTPESSVEIPGDGSLASAVLALLREADASDDNELIKRVIALQDRLLLVGFPGMELMLDEASERR
jgi:hypothetical protein